MSRWARTRKALASGARARPGTVARALLGAAAAHGPVPGWFRLDGGVPNDARWSGVDAFCWGAARGSPALSPTRPDSGAAVEEQTRQYFEGSPFAGAPGGRPRWQQHELRSLLQKDAHQTPSIVGFGSEMPLLSPPASAAVPTRPWGAPSSQEGAEAMVLDVLCGVATTTPDGDGAAQGQQKPTYEMSSVLKKRRAKIKKHWLKKRRRRNRYKTKIGKSSK